MAERELDYTTLSVDDLLDIERHINRDLVPDRWARLQAALAPHRSEIAKTSGSFDPTRAISRGAFVLLHMAVTAVMLIIGFVAFPGEGGEAAVGRDFSLIFVMPAAVLLSAASILIHPVFLRARNPRAFLVLSIVITPIASLAALVLGSAVLFSLCALVPEMVTE